MAIFARPADTWSGPTLMGQVLPGPIKNRAGFGFLKKKPETGPGFYKTLLKPGPDLTRLKLKLPKKP